jgi:hypothetical protein
MKSATDNMQKVRRLVVPTLRKRVDVPGISLPVALGICFLTSISDPNVAFAQEMNWSGPYGGSDLGHRTKWCSRTYESFSITEDAQNGGFRTEKQDAKHHTSIKYDEAGRITKVEFAGTITIYKYDVAGSWLEVQEQKSVLSRTRILADKAARIVERQSFVGADARPTSTTKYRYDAFGRANAIGSEIQLQRKYDKAGRVREIQIGSRQEVFRYGEKSEPRTRTTYLGGRLEEVREFFVDTTGKIVAQIGRRQNGFITSSATYSYDGNGNLASEVTWVANEFKPATPGLKYLTRFTYSYGCWPAGKAPPANCNLLGDCPE